MRSVTVIEPEWDDEELAWMLAWHETELDRCSGCNGVLSETTDPRNEGWYIAENPTRCHRCTAIFEKASEYNDARQPRALMFSAHLPAERR